MYTEKQVRSILNSPKVKQNPFAEEGLFSELYPNSANLPFEWNTPDTQATAYSKAIHFLSRKPWFNKKSNLAKEWNNVSAQYLSPD